MFNTARHLYTTLSHPSRPPIIRRTRLTLATLCLTTSALIILSLITHLRPPRSGFHPCLPFSLHKISSTAHRTFSCHPRPLTAHESGGDMTHTTNGAKNRLGDFLRERKTAFLSDVKKGSLAGWTVVTGNEAGDLDSLASSVAFAYLSSTFSSEKSIPLILTPSTLMHLRPENQLALSKANTLDPAALLHSDQIPGSSVNSLQQLTTLGAKYALVDHNKLLPQFGDGEVIAIIDHHEDEHVHENAGLRVITVPTGSCASLVTRHFKEKWTAALSGNANGADAKDSIPEEVATLLLSAIIIDTGGLRAGGKATPVDQDSAAFLYPLSGISDGTSSSFESTSGTPPAIGAFSNELSEAKSDVSQLGTHDLLLRDYKEYLLTTSSTAYPTLKAGLSTVPLGLKAQLKNEKDGWTSYMAEVDRYMKSRELDVEGVLTSYSNKNGKHRRELLLVTKTGHSFNTPDQAEKFMQELIKGFEASGELKLAEWDGGAKEELHPGKALDDQAKGRFGWVWKQENRKATRKQVAPLLKEVVSQLQ